MNREDELAYAIDDLQEELAVMTDRAAALERRNVELVGAIRKAIDQYWNGGEKAEEDAAEAMDILSKALESKS